MVARHQGLREENRENQDVRRGHPEKGARLAAHDSRIP